MARSRCGTPISRAALRSSSVPRGKGCAHSLLERLAADYRERERVLLVSSDSTVLGTAGQQVAKLSSQTFFRDLEPSRHRDDVPGGLADKLDSETRERLERLRRGLR